MCRPLHTRFVLLAAFVCGCASAQDGGHEDHCHRRFEDAEEWAKRWDDPARDAWQKPDEVVRLLDLEADMSAVDLGAGTGYFLGRLSRAVGPEGKVIALDIEPDMVRYMKERVAREEVANVEVRQVEPSDPGLPEGSVDRILIVDTWHHIAERPAYAALLARALRPGGRVYVVDYALESPEGPPVGARIAPDQVVRELEAGGLSAAVLEETLPRHYIVAACLAADPRPPSWSGR